MADCSKGDDEENEYNTIRHAKGGKGVKLLYSKSKVRHRIHFRSCATRTFQSYSLLLKPASTNT